jgi:predicted Rossmann fold flavoprotein
VPVSGLIRNRNGIGGIEAGGALFPAHTTILAVGGSSYPKTGTTGDGFRWCRELGHTLVPLRAALAPLYLVPDDCRPEWSGVALRDCTVRARRSAPEGSVGKELARWRGDLLYTHQGVSGPAVLEISGPVASAMEQSGATVEADLVPDQPEEALHSLFAAAHATQGRKTVRAVAAAWVPERLLPALFERAALAPHITLHQLSRPARHRLVQAMKRWRIGAVRAVPLERGEVTAGGVSLDEVDPRTMASRRVNGLYLCGELLDIAGPVGGYNLQAAFSTGYVAGEAAAAATVRHDAGSG